MIDEQHLSDLITRGLSDIKYPSAPRGLYQPVEYTLESGGKRLRPLLCLAACVACGAPAETALQQALAVEMFHNFTLIHDDVMDRSDKRRGRPTVFARWGDIQAILSGDALLTMATMRAALCPAAVAAEVMNLFNTTAMEVYEGQQFDMEFENRDDVTVDEYIAMIRLKTSVLLACACRMGALMADADASTLQALYDYGIALGLAFQLRDDWLDTFGDADTFGKPIGGDILNRKKTWLFITAMNEAPAAMATALADNPGDRELIAAVTGIYRSLDLDNRCAALVKKHCADAIAALSRASIDADSRAWFAALAHKLSFRDR